jgi:probable non-F420 flavinoid oxidoreductase
MTARIAYHVSHEQFAPSDLLRYVQHAEAAGFDAALSSDHLHPWNPRQGHSGFAWSWLGAALASTRSMPMGVVNAPGWRYHPVIIAQAAATLAEMFPERFFLCVGSGEALNEHVTGERWPPKPERNARLRECVDVIRALWAGEMVTHHGRVTVEEARVWSLPAEPPLLVGACVSPETAEWLGGWADAMVTVSRPREQIERVIDAWRRGGGEGKPMYLKVQASYAATDEEARQGAWEQWRTNVFGGDTMWELRTPGQFEQASEFVRREDRDDAVRVSSEPERHAEWLQKDLEMGFELVSVHNVNREQERFIDAFGERVLPLLRDR